MVILHQISNLSRLPSPSLTLLIRRDEVEIYRFVERHRSQPLELFVWVVVTLGFAAAIIILVDGIVFVLVTLG